MDRHVNTSGVLQQVFHNVNVHRVLNLFPLLVETIFVMTAEMDFGMHKTAPTTAALLILLLISMWSSLPQLLIKLRSEFASINKDLMKLSMLVSWSYTYDDYVVDCSHILVCLPLLQ